MRTAIATVLLLTAVVPVKAGGPDFELRQCTVHEVKVEPEKIVFTVSGPITIYLVDPGDWHTANPIATSLERCIITITKSNFEKSGEKTTWAERQALARTLTGKRVGMQLRGTATLKDSRVTSIDTSAYCYFHPE